MFLRWRCDPVSLSRVIIFGSQIEITRRISCLCRINLFLVRGERRLTPHLGEDEVLRLAGGREVGVVERVEGRLVRVVEGVGGEVDGGRRSVNKVVGRTGTRLDRGRAGEGVVRLSYCSSSTVHQRLVDEVGRGRGDLSLAALVEDGGPVPPDIVHGVLDGLQTTVREADVIGPGGVPAVSVLGVAELVATVVILHCVGKYVVILQVDQHLQTKDIRHRYHIDRRL